MNTKNITNTTVSSNDDTLVRVSLSFMGDTHTYDKYMAVALADGCIVVSDKKDPDPSHMRRTTLIDSETNQVFNYSYLPRSFFEHTAQLQVEM